MVESEAGQNTAKSNSPLDYSETLYRFYFEVGEYNGVAKEVIDSYLGTAKAKSVLTLTHGYEVVLPIQATPELVRRLVNRNIAVYQIVRIGQTDGRWRE